MKNVIVSILSLVVITLFAAQTVFAARGDLGTIPTGQWGGLGTYNLNFYLERFLNFAIGSGAVGFLLMFIWASYQWLTAGGDVKAVDGARRRMTTAVIGLVLLGCTFAIFNIVKAITYDPARSGGSTPTGGGPVPTTTPVGVTCLQTYNAMCTPFSVDPNDCCATGLTCTQSGNTSDYYCQ